LHPTICGRGPICGCGLTKESALANPFGPSKRPS
jgi:hypothetical protein